MKKNYTLSFLSLLIFGVTASAQAVDDFAITDQNVPAAIYVLANDNLSGGLAAEPIAIVSPPSYGQVVLNDNGSPTDMADDYITYTPDNNYNGVDTFIYQITDASMVTSTATVTVVITPPTTGGDPPLAIDDNAATQEDIAVVINILENDAFGEDLYSISIVDAPANGTAVINNQGTPGNPTDDTITYTPNPSFYGADSFVYEISDIDGDTSMATVTLYVSEDGFYEPPFATNDIATTDEDNPVTIAVIGNDSFGSEGPGSLSIASQPVNGTAVINDNGTPADPLDDTITYTPNANYNGPDTFTYSITDSSGNAATGSVTVNIVPDVPSADLPVAVNDNAVTMEDTPVTIAVVTNDDLVGSTTWTLAITTPPSNGWAVVNNNGTPGDVSDDTITYTPNPNYNGIDSLDYSYLDANLVAVATAVAFIVITPDVPTLDVPLATNDGATISEDTAVVINVLANDSFGGDGPSFGSISVNPTMPEVTAMGGMVSVNDNGTPQDPTDDTIIYQPNLDITGVDIFTYTITDANGDTATATVTVQIGSQIDPEEVPPVAVDDMVTTGLNTAVEIDVLANDTGVNSQFWGISIQEAPSHGNVIINENETPAGFDNTITYMPETGFTGQDSFIYKIFGSLGMDYATVSVTVGGNGNGSIVLKAFFDANGNGVQDLSEEAFTQGKFHYEKNNDGTVVDGVSSTGNYYISVNNPADTYDLNYSINNDLAQYYTVATQPFQDITAVPSESSEFKFAITGTVFTDVNVELIPISSPRPGFTYINMIAYHNNSAQSVSGTLTFGHDSIVTINSVSQGGIVNTATGFTYDFSLPPFGTQNIYVLMQVPVIPTVALGDLLTNTVTIFVNDDAAPNNNTSAVTQTIIGSYDPNDITESHGEKIVHSTFTADDYLYYTIRFENTGTANAENIRVENMLDAQLDEGTIEMVNASDNYTMERTESNLVWNFDNIQLPPVEENMTVGHGYLTYRIKPKSGYAIGDIIPNTANIYFDFNPAIVTNTFNTVFVSTLSIADANDQKLSAYPNPTKGMLNISGATVIENVVVYNLLGQVVLKKEISGNNGSIDVSSLPNGIYNVRIASAEAEKSIRIIKN
ncbi:Ig-like domain-containing protein [Flavobacterium sp. BFFFF1]|uniref:Ig-like domain-containing protein n=1 Tax=Flavobacterium sp. BFFFF1 TaxID=2015557 RepID=UPI0025BA8A3B|nr:Ig-like domain-containing protein [Flavobacterium sp. BFFFF1]